MQVNSIGSIDFLQNRKTEQIGTGFKSLITDKTKSLNSLPNYQQSVAFGMSVVKPAKQALQQIKPLIEDLLKNAVDDPEASKNIIRDFNNLNIPSKNRIAHYQIRKGSSLFANLLKTNPDTALEYLNFVSNLYSKTSHNGYVFGSDYLEKIAKHRSKFVKDNIKAAFALDGNSTFRHPEVAKKFSFFVRNTDFLNNFIEKQN
jgi:hypothetical protein